MIKKIGALLVTLLGGALLVYSASRSLDFIELTLPADRKILAYFGLAALDGGIVAWLLSYLNGSRGAWQRAISMLMVVIDTCGAIAFFTLDTLYNAGKNGMTKVMTTEQMTNAILALSGVIALNIIATIAHHITDPDKLREQAEEEAFAKVEDATLKQISKNADSLAAQLAPVMAADWQTQTQAKYLSYVGTGRLPVVDVTSQNMPVLAQPQAQPFSLGALWAGLVGEKKVYNSDTVMPVVKPTEAKTEKPEPFYNPLDNNLYNEPKPVETEAKPEPTYHPVSKNHYEPKPEPSYHPITELFQPIAEDETGIDPLSLRSNGNGQDHA